MHGVENIFLAIYNMLPCFFLNILRENCIVSTIIVDHIL